ncbi:DUF2993 domain-containing protein [Actinocorallia sp. B10E7]|uniref:LmeA family phospholipid-binding protein n=1 Tax=Actinocorallia sp. B10E7 TaxID=3153558 RepID=UPI00325D5D3B
MKRSPSRRAAIIVLSLGLVSGAAAGADRYLAHRTADRLAERATCLLEGTPEVSVSGFPFVVQALTRELDEVRVTADGVRRGGITVSALDVRLFGVSVPDEGGVAVERLDAHAVVPFSAIEDALPRQGGELSYENGMLAISTEVRRGGLSVPATVLAVPSLAGGKLTITPEYVKVLGRLLPARRLLDRLGEQPELSRDLPDLPDGLAYSEVAVTDGGLRVGMRAADLRVDGSEKADGGRSC